MFTEFVGLQLTREELVEIHRALLQRAILEDELAKEKGDTSEPAHPLLERMENLLGETEEQVHLLDHHLEDQLWEYSWYAFTDEWAWFRSKQVVEARNAETGISMSDAELQKAVEAEYRKNFETYAIEVAMQDLSSGKSEGLGKRFSVYKNQGIE